MYIGPWQEYRLAKIQDDAIQRLKKEFEDQLRGQLPTTEEARIREMMQPMMAKLPSLLLATKRGTTSSSNGANRAQLRDGGQSEAGSRNSSRPQSAQSTAARTRDGTSRGGYGTSRHVKAANNQETHEYMTEPPLKPHKPKKKKSKKAPPLTALEQVQKRKKMFATWIKQAGSNNKDGKDENSTVNTSPEAQSRSKTTAGIVTRLPVIPSAVPANAAALIASTRPKESPPLVLPLLNQLKEVANEPQLDQDPNNSSPTIAGDDIDLDESVDEDAVNNLLNWTDTLLSPTALDSLDFDA